MENEISDEKMVMLNKILKLLEHNSIKELEETYNLLLATKLMLGNF